MSSADSVAGIFKGKEGVLPAAMSVCNLQQSENNGVGSWFATEINWLWKLW